MTAAVVEDWEALRAKAETSAASGDYTQSVIDYDAAIRALRSVSDGGEASTMLAAQCEALLQLRDWPAAAGLARELAQLEPSWDRGGPVGVGIAWRGGH